MAGDPGARGFHLSGRAHRSRPRAPPVSGSDVPALGPRPRPAVRDDGSRVEPAAGSVRRAGGECPPHAGDAARPAASRAGGGGIGPPRLRPVRRGGVESSGWITVHTARQGEVDRGTKGGNGGRLVQPLSGSGELQPAADHQCSPSGSRFRPSLRGAPTTSGYQLPATDVAVPSPQHDPRDLECRGVDRNGRVPGLCREHSDGREPQYSLAHRPMPQGDQLLSVGVAGVRPWGIRGSISSSGRIVGRCSWDR